MNDKYEPNPNTAEATMKKESVAGETSATEGTVSALRAGLTRSESKSTQNPKLNWTEPESTHGNQCSMGESGRHHHRAGSDATNPAPDCSFLDLVRQTVSKKGNDVFATWYDSHGEATNEYTFGELWEEAGRISHYLRNEWDLKKGDRVVLCYNLGLHFFAVFLGCLRAGVIAVLVYPPIPPLSQSLPKMNKVIADCDAHLILIDSDIAMLRKADKWNPLSKTRQEWPDDNHLRVTNKLARSLPVPGQEPLEFDEVISPDDLAFFQYTSGSTGDPKGVMVTFGALSANVGLILNLIYSGAERDGIVVPNEKSGFSWLPQYHDMGLIHGTIAPFAAGCRMHMMSPLDFIRNPLLWLDLMSRHHVLWGVAPDFAYSLVARKYIEAKERNNGIEPIPGLDLSSILFLNNAAEPIRTNTVETFGKVFAEHGLREEWMAASYGLAENVVGVCGFHGYHLSDPRDEDKFPLVACGSRDTFEHNQVIKIVDPKTSKEVEDGETGELWVSGPSVAAGYFQKPELTEEVFHAKMVGSKRKFLRTGDLAFFQDDKLFICGRIKDLIIINGVNYYPQDVEYAVQEASPVVRHGCVAAFVSGDTGNSSDGLEVVFEIRNAGLQDVDEVIQAVRRSVTQRIGLLPSRIVAIKERTIPKTTSGKIKRKATRSSLHAGKLDIVSEDHTALGFGRGTSTNANQGEDEKQGTDSELSCRSRTGTARSNKHFALIDLTSMFNSICRWAWTWVTSCLVFLSRQILLRPGSINTTAHLVQHELSFDGTSQRLPREAVTVIRAIEVNIDKLNLTFHELGLHLIPEIAREWELVDKSNSALHAMCETSMKAIEQHYPVLVEFAHLLLAHPDWISAQNGKEILVDIVHCGFVINWATCKVGTDMELMQSKMKLDAEHERFLVAGHESMNVPEDFRFLVDEKAEDPLLGALDFFYWLKYRSVTHSLKLSLAASRGSSQVANVGEDSLSLSILAASWLENKFGFKDNSFVGKRLAARTSCSQEGCRMHLKECSKFAEVYLSWNLASTMILKDPSLDIAILLIPCIVGCETDLFLWNRNISLFLATNALVARFLRGHKPGSFVLRSATEALGALNKKWAASLDPVDPPEEPVAGWLRKLDKWEKDTVPQNEDHKETESIETVIVNNMQAKTVNAEVVDLVRRTVASMLGVPPDEIPINRPLAEIGLTSMMAVELSDFLSCSTDREFPLTLLYGDSTTLETIASFIEGLDLPTAEPANLWDEVSKQVKQLQHLQDGQTLDPPTKVPFSAKMPTVLVTGATGYLGSHVLHSLLKNTKEMSIMLLVRAKDETEALERVHAALASNELLSRKVAMQVKERCRMVCGDLSLPNLGLKESHFLQVGRQISAIVHCGAKVHHLASYDSLMSTNVDGTKEILRLSAATGSPLKTPVLYMSTTGVFGGQTKDGAVNVMEDNDALDEHDKLSSGYAQSKLVAEQLCRGAQQQGWPVCILRVGFLLPRMGHEVWQEQSIASAVLASFRILGVFPTDISLNVTTVDFAARATVHILQRSMGNHPEKVWTTFHLCDPPSSLVGASTACRWLSIRGTPTRKVSFKEYLAILSEKAMNCSDPTVAVNLTTLEQLISHHGANLIFDNSRLAGILKGSRIKMPRMSRMSLRRLLKLYHSSRLFVQAPTSGETFLRSEVAQLHDGYKNKPSRVHSLSPFAGKGAKRNVPVEHVRTSVTTSEASTCKVSSGDTGSEPDSDELADTKPKRNHTAPVTAILRRRKENKVQEQAMTGTLNDTVTALSAASGKRATGTNEELAFFKMEAKNDMKRIMSMVEQIASRGSKDEAIELPGAPGKSSFSHY